jgi:predicted DNA-binding antitoxin AbrB/MazE fold protein
MTKRVIAVYESGTLRPITPLPLRNGDRVEITIEVALPSATVSSSESAAQRIRDAKSFDEWMVGANAAAATEPDDGYDLLEALNENRRATGAPRLLYPSDQKGITW